MEPRTPSSGERFRRTKTSATRKYLTKEIFDGLKRNAGIPPAVAGATRPRGH